MWALLLLLPACHGPDWTADGVFEGAWARFARSPNGALDEETWVHTAYHVPAFDTVDNDGDGRISAEEMKPILLAQDPVTFDGSGARDPVRTALNPDIFHPYSYDVRIVRELFQFLGEEARAKDPAVDVPSEAEIEAAAQTGNLDAPAARALLTRYQAAWRKVGLVFPRRLIPEGAPSSPAG